MGGTVKSNNNVATFIKEFVLNCQEAKKSYRAGGYIQINVLHVAKYVDFAIENKFCEDWDKYDLWRYVSDVKSPPCAPIRWQAIRKKKKSC
jgi:Na+-transporting NADH:ubiquinone oxidoreductase subunit F